MPGTSNQHQISAHSLEQDSRTSPRMARSGHFGVSKSCCPIWGVRQTVYTLFSRRRGGATVHFPNERGSVVRLGGLRGRWSYQDLRGGEREICQGVCGDGGTVSSSFVVLQGGSQGRKGMFVVNIWKQSKHCKKGSVKMESMSEFALSLQMVDHMLSMYI